MMLMYVVFAPILISIATGAFLFAWSERKESKFGKFMGMFVTILAFLLLIMQVWSTSKMWQEGTLIKRDMQKMMRQMPDNTQEKK